MTPRSRAILALCLLAPAPSVGIVIAFYLNEGPLGVVAWAAAKVWLFGLPAAWWLWVEKQPVSFSPAKKGGWGVSVLTGIVAAGGIVGGYFLIGKSFIDPEILKKQLEPLGLVNPAVYLAGAAYWIAVNSVLEEYVFRWFIFQQCETALQKRAALAVVFSGVIFTVHHSLAMGAYFPWWINLIASLAILLAGCAWSWLYLRYRSIWVPYVSHAMADLAIFWIGYRMLFQ